MRIISGEFRGQVLQAPRGRNTRPTSDRVREALFSMLEARLGPLECDEGEDPWRALDLYAGSGALGLEALSRGAAAATFVDHDRASVRVIKENIVHLKVEGRCRVLAMKVKPALVLLREEGRTFGLVLADPPYAESPETVLEMIGGSGILRPGGMAVLEHAKRVSVPDAVEGAPALEKVITRFHGDTGLSLYSFAQRGVE